ncbi:Diaminopimelate epimerase-like protein [Irpex rosettiformis]|uniref:Diaminopimelate epimerase-like protein n=1 Tax=Irpex rosettiformis TaxID=378272 RepID=A0ACB8TT58_9APHY|nr:Diaminopimelate epimerase-like protein [Irpex rosettiformis]
MDVFNALSEGKIGRHDIVVRTVDMHTSGEATRIVLPLVDKHGQFILRGRTLLDKRSYAKEQADWLRQRIMHEPRGHSEMYGAILVPETEMTLAGEADIGVLFCHNEGYSTMCGHASIALGRFLVDTTDSSVFPRRKALQHSAHNGETIVRLHAPCGIVTITVPTTNENSWEKRRSDPTRRVNFLSVPSFVGAVDVTVEVPEGRRWRALQDAGKNNVTVDISYGGAFYAVVSSHELGFVRGILEYGISELDEATATIKNLLRDRREFYAHPTEDDLEYLYGVIVTEQLARNYELGACFFANQQLDRSPTGSGVCARVSLACAKGKLALGEEVLFESPISLGKGIGFSGKAVGQAALKQKDGRTINTTRVVVSGRAYYTGSHSFVVEEGDELGSGFITPS